MAGILVSLLLIITSFPLLTFAHLIPNGENSQISADFPEPIASIEVENARGTIEVHTWNNNLVRAIARRKDGAPLSLNKDLYLEKVAAQRLKVTAQAPKNDYEISLVVYVPVDVSLSVRAVNGAATIKGLTSALTAEVQTGSLVLHLPQDSNADISMRSIDGTVASEIPLALFGQADAKRLDGRIGAGGHPVILRSVKGQISLVADDPSRIASATRLFEGAGASSKIKIVSHLQAAAPGQNEESDSPELSKPKPASAPLVKDENAIRLETRLVNLNVKVANAAGKVIPNLKKEDFLVLEDNAQQDITYFESINAPVNVVLLLDLSGSIKDKMKIMKKAAKKFIDALGPSDQIAVATFSGRFTVISSFTTDRKLLKDRIDDIKNRNSGTRFYDAMCSTLDLFNEVSGARKAVVVLTDGVDSSIPNPDFKTAHSFEEMLGRIVQEEASIYPIYLDTEYEMVVKRGMDNHEAYVTARKQLQSISDQTGTLLFKVNRIEDLEGVYQRVAAELHTLYSIAYTPKIISKDDKWRSINVQVKQAGAVARTKRGYYAR